MEKCLAPPGLEPQTVQAVNKSRYRLTNPNCLTLCTSFIIIILVTTFMHGVYNYIPETNHVSRVYSVAAVLYLQSVLHVMLFRLWNMFCAFTLALPAVCVQLHNMAVFCSSLISCFPGTLLRYTLSDSEMVPVAPIITAITFYFTFYMSWNSIVSSLYFKIFSASLLITFLSSGIATSSKLHVPCLLSRIMMSGLLLEIVLSVRTWWFHNMIILYSWLVSTDVGTYMVIPESVARFHPYFLSYVKV